MRMLVMGSLVVGLAVATPAFSQEPGSQPRDQTREGTEAGDTRDMDGAIQAEAEGEYVVKQGDTLTEIAQQRLGDASRWRQIAQLNGIDDPKKLAVGKRLQLPTASSPGRAGQDQRRAEARGSSGSSF